MTYTTKYQTQETLQGQDLRGWVNLSCRRLSFSLLTLYSLAGRASIRTNDLGALGGRIEEVTLIAPSMAIHGLVDAEDGAKVPSDFLVRFITFA
jgi:hypothetical protein